MLMPEHPSTINGLNGGVQVHIKLVDTLSSPRIFRLFLCVNDSYLFFFLFHYLEQPFSLTKSAIYSPYATVLAACCLLYSHRHRCNLSTAVQVPMCTFIPGILPTRFEISGTLSHLFIISQMINLVILLHRWHDLQSMVYRIRKRF